MKRTKITANLPTPIEETNIIAALTKNKTLKSHRLTIDIPANLYEALQQHREKKGYTTVSSAILEAIRKFMNE